jgi:hypothetical protein|tara:strand:- start:561 stop:944 length:384 start_codon:yes stop_codon:yes gene_type:complete
MSKLDNRLGGKRRRAEGDIELDPLCFKDEIAFAVTNQGVLVPCCRFDDPATMGDTQMKPLIEASKISENNTIDDILKKEEWKQFADNLSKNIGPAACLTTCAKAKKYTQVVEWIDTEKGVATSVEKK